MKYHKSRKDGLMTVLNGSGLTASAVSGLTNAFSIIAARTSTGKIKLSDLTATDAATLQALGYNTTFLSYLTNNFSTMDKNHDGELSANELSTITSTMQNQGLTAAELSSLCADGVNSSLYQTVLDYFDKIDTNNDGRVSQEEISAFSFKSKRQKMDTQFNGFKKSSTSLYYSDENADDTPSSLIDDLYPDM